MNEYPQPMDWHPPQQGGQPQHPGPPQTGGFVAWPEGAYKDSIGFALWCLFFVGLGGVHRIYLGKYGTGIIWLLTFGLFGIGQFLDLFRMKGLVRESNIREGYLPHPRYAYRLAAPPPSPPAPTGPTMQQVLLRAAAENGGALTVTQGVLVTGLTFEKVEELLREMVAKGHVDVDNAPDSGVVVYRFPELSGPLH